jgi:hypothetical protein
MWAVPSGLSVSENATLGDPLIQVVTVRPVVEMRTVPPAAPPLDLVPLLDRIAQLEQRVALLEQQTPAAYWQRAVAWCRRQWERFRWH